MKKNMLWALLFFLNVRIFTLYCTETSQYDILAKVIDANISMPQRVDLMRTCPKRNSPDLLIHYLYRFPDEDMIYPNTIIDHLFSNGACFLGNYETTDKQRFPHCFHYISCYAVRKAMVSISPQQQRKIFNNLLFITKLCLNAQLKECKKDIALLFWTLKNFGVTIKNKIPKVLMNKIISIVLLNKDAVLNIIHALDIPSVENPDRKNVSERVIKPLNAVKINIEKAPYLTKEGKKDYLYEVKFLDPQEWKNNSISLVKKIQEDLQKTTSQDNLQV